MFSVLIYLHKAVCALTFLVLFPNFYRQHIQPSLPCHHNSRAPSSSSGSCHWCCKRGLKTVRLIIVPGINAIDFKLGILLVGIRTSKFSEIFQYFPFLSSLYLPMSFLLQVFPFLMTLVFLSLITSLSQPYIERAACMCLMNFLECMNTTHLQFCNLNSFLLVHKLGLVLTI